MDTEENNQLVPVADQIQVSLLELFQVLNAFSSI